MKRATGILCIAAVLLLAPAMMMPTGSKPPTVALLSGPALAVQPDEILPDPALERRARAISSGLRCLVCQNQSIDDSDADLAKDLRLLVRERLRAGDSDGSVVGYIVARYGEFVLLQPRLSPATIVLWGTPVVLLLAGAAFATMSARRRRQSLAPRLTLDEEIALQRTLNDNGL